MTVAPTLSCGQHSLTGHTRAWSRGTTSPLSPEIVPEQRGVRSSGDQVDPVSDPGQVQTGIKSHPKKLNVQSGEGQGLSWSPRATVLLPPCPLASGPDSPSFPPAGQPSRSGKLFLAKR